MDDNDKLTSLGNSNGSSISNSTRPIRKGPSYAGRSGRELSTSAAKRQSVMALGSIRYLQHLYTKNGLASNNAPIIGASGQPLPLALPGHVPSTSNALIEEDEEGVNPAPFPPLPPDTSFEVEIPSLRNQRQDVYREVAEVCSRWNLIELGKFANLNTRRESSTGGSSDADVSHTRTSSPLPFEQQDNLVLTLINTTTSAIRAAQKYFLTLPPEKLPGGSATPKASESSSRFPQQIARGVPGVGVITASRPIPRHSQLGVAATSKRSLSPSNSQQSSGSTLGPPSDDPLIRLRRVSLATLGALKEMERRYRLPGQREASIDDLNDSVQDISVSSETSSSIGEGNSVSGFSGTTSDYTKGHLYREDVSLRDLTNEAQIVKEWIDTVDTLLSEVLKESKIVSRQRTKSGNLEEGGAVPKWAREDAFEGNTLGRLRACLATSLPSSMLSSLPISDDPEELLLALSDGQLLCTAYNSILRASQRPWGFIPSESIHDIITLAQQREREEAAAASASRGTSLDGSAHLTVESVSMRRSASSDGGGSSDGPKRIGLTFRRMENLRVFMAAVKLRYLVQFKGSIDLKVIARKEEGWMEMLKELACCWVMAAAEEKRNEEPDSE